MFGPLPMVNYFFAKLLLMPESIELFFVDVFSPVARTSRFEFPENLSC